MTLSDPERSAETRRSLFNRAALILLILWISSDALATNVFGKRHWPEGIVDFRVLYEKSRSVVATHAYPAYYPYPPPSVALQYALAQFPFPVSAAIFLALTIIGTLLCWKMLHAMLFQKQVRAAYPLLLFAYASSNYFFQWDLRSQNCNILFFLCFLYGVYYLVLHRPTLAGFWLAASIALKMFSIVTLPYLFWKGERKACAALIGFSIVFWIALPCLLSSPQGAVEVYRNWFHQIQLLSAENWVDTAHPILISLNRGAEWISQRYPLSRAEMLFGFRALWGILLLYGVALSGLRTRQKTFPADAFELLTDMSLILLCPIALSSYLEPYHPVPFASVALLLLAAGTDTRLPTRLRRIAWAAFLLSAVVSLLPTPFEARGLIVNLKLLIGQAGLVWTAHARHLFLAARLDTNVSAPADKDAQRKEAEAHTRQEPC